MKGSLSSFSSNKNSQENKDCCGDNIKQKVLDEYENIKNLSQDEASQRLYEEVFKQKQSGSFNFNELEKQVDSLQGYLSAKDFQNIKRILYTLR